MTEPMMPTTMFPICPKTTAFDELSGKPAGHSTDHKPNKDAFRVHWLLPSDARVVYVAMRARTMNTAFRSLPVIYVATRTELQVLPLVAAAVRCNPRLTTLLLQRPPCAGARLA